MQPKETFDVLAAHFGPEVIFDFHADPKKDKDPWFQVKPYEIEQVAEFLKTDPRFSIDTLECLTGVDYPDKNNIVVVYPQPRPAQASYRSAARTCDAHAGERVVREPAERSASICSASFEGHLICAALLPDDWEGHRSARTTKKEEYRDPPSGPDRALQHLPAKDGARRRSHERDRLHQRMREMTSTWVPTIRPRTASSGSSSRATARSSGRPSPTSATCIAASRRSASAARTRATCRTPIASTTSLPCSPTSAGRPRARSSWGSRCRSARSISARSRASSTASRAT